jgi:hypothetical protein
MENDSVVLPREDLQVLTVGVLAGVLPLITDLPPEQVPASIQMLVNRFHNLKNRPKNSPWADW